MSNLIKKIFVVLVMLNICSLLVADNINITSDAAFHSALANITSGATLELAPGNYTLENTIESGITITTSNFASDTLDDIIIDCHEQQLFEVSGGSSEVIIQGVVIVNAKSNGNGGAISVKNQSLTLDSCIFYKCTASKGDGGAVYFKNIISKNLNIQNCSFIDCVADNGGAIYTNETSEKSGAISNNYFYQNIAHEKGGAIYATNGGLLLNGNSIASCKANDGGGIYLEVIDAKVTNCTIQGNRSSLGSGIYYNKNDDVSNIEFYNNILWNNATANDNFNSQLYIGGDVYLNIRNCFIQDGENVIKSANQSSYDFDSTNITEGEPGFIFSDMPYLTKDSCCIDIGSDVEGVAIDKTNRKLDGDNDGYASTDIGSFEYAMNDADNEYNSNMKYIFPYPYVRLDYYVKNNISKPFYLKLVNIGAKEYFVKPYNNLSWLKCYYDDVMKDKVTLNLSAPVRKIGLYKLGNRRLIVEARDIKEHEVYPSTISDVQDIINEDCRDGDVVLLEDSVTPPYIIKGPIDFMGKNIVFRSKSREPKNCKIIYEGSDYLFNFINGETEDCCLEGLEIDFGSSSTCKAMNITNSSAPMIKNCILKNITSSNTDDHCVYIKNSTPVFYKVELLNIDAKCFYVEGSSCMMSNVSFSTISAYCINAINSRLELKNSDKFASGVDDGTVIVFDGTENSELIIDDVCFYENNNSTIIEMKGGNLLVSNSEFNDNGKCIKYNNADIYTDPEANNSLFVVNSQFIENDQTAIESYAPNNLVINSVFYKNTGIDSSGGIHFNNSCDDNKIFNCTFYKNLNSSGGSTDIYTDSIASSPIVYNSIFWQDDKSAYTSYFNKLNKLYYSCVNTNDVNQIIGISCRENIVSDPSFWDKEIGDLTLEISSPCIGTGYNITNRLFDDELIPNYLSFSDVRGSVRPVIAGSQGTDREHNNFDIGAYEYSGFHSGNEDGAFKAFSNIKIPEFSQVGTPCTITWEKSDGFVDYNSDYRIQDSQNKEYSVNLYLVSDDRPEKKFITRKTVSATVSAEGYYSFNDILFSPEHEGEWKLRLELVNDPHQFNESKMDCFISSATPELIVIGNNPISPPEGANASIKPEIPEGYEDAFFWSDYTKKLYAVQPATVFLIWKDYQGDDRPQLVTSKFPDDSSDGLQYYVAGSPEVELIKEGSTFEDDVDNDVQLNFVEIKYTTCNAVITGNTKFLTNSDGYTVLQYGETSDYDCQPYFLVVRSILWKNSDKLLNKQAIVGREIMPEDYINHPLLSDDVSLDSGIETTIHDFECGNGYLFPITTNEKIDRTPYDADIYDRDNHSGQIFPVNISNPSLNVETAPSDIVVIWYKKGYYGGFWPYQPARYKVQWPNDDQCGKIVIASELGSDNDSNDGDLSEPDYGNCNNITIYNQPNRDLPGFNPNEEHAAIFPANDDSNKPAVFALRNDLNVCDDPGLIGNGINDGSKEYTSAPYVLVKYQKAGNNKDWFYRTYEVLAETGEYTFKKTWDAGEKISPPYPISEMFPRCSESHPEVPGFNGVDIDLTVEWPEKEDFSSNAIWQDYKRGIWGRCEGEGVIYWYYPMQNDFYYDVNNDGVNDYDAGDSLPWLSKVVDEDNPKDDEMPIKVKYDIEWPGCPVVKIGQTLIDAKEGLPDIMDQPSVWILYDEPNFAGNPSVRMFEALSSVCIEGIPDDVFNMVSNKLYKGKKYFELLPYYIRDRIYYDPLDEKLIFKGKLMEFSTGEPLLLPNIMTDFELNMLLMLDDDDMTKQKLTREDIIKYSKGDSTDYDGAIRSLYIKTRLVKDTGMKKLMTPGKVLSAGDAKGVGYVTLAFSADPSLETLPITLEVFRVIDEPYSGQLIVLDSEDNVFDENLTLRHSSDFAGNPERDNLQFEWVYKESLQKPDTPVGNDSIAINDVPSWTNGTHLSAIGKDGGLQISDDSAGDMTILKDRWYSCHYKIDLGSGNSKWSDWTEPQLHENWLKRVMKKVNLFDQRVKDFYENPVHSLVSMIAQIGGPYNGNVALSEDAAVLNEKGLLEIYQTLLDRAKDLSINIDGVPTASEEKDAAILFAATRVADFYAILGNEAYGDAQDPTIGIGTGSDAYGEAAPSIFCFQNQYSSLLEEELVLLRGSDEVKKTPLYNRAIWNLTIGDGEIAYALNYNLTDMDEDGDVDDMDAMLMYPQGHGDAWGHYLSGVKVYYDLLRNSNFSWTPQTESILVGQEAVAVDYIDERKFAALAASKAKTGAEIVNLTYRDSYSEDTDLQWKGYKDQDSSRNWGVYEWAGRAGLGAYFDWVTVNSLLYDEDPNTMHEGIEIVDRNTVTEIKEISNAFTSIQNVLNNADNGLNPLGVSKDSIPFDINPTELVNTQNEPAGRSHFEQIYDRAITALNNATTTFNYANESVNRLRRQEDTVEQFVTDIQDQEYNYESQLIEIFGYPYSDDISVLGTYPEGYEGPDLVHYMYVDVSELFGLTQKNDIEQEVDLIFTDIDENGVAVKSTRKVKYNISNDGYGLIKPAEWGQRKAPGEIQNAYSEYLVTLGRFQKAIIEYENLTEQIDDQAELLQSQYVVNTNEIFILNSTYNQQMTLNQHILESKKKQYAYRTLATKVKLLADSTSSGIPGVMGIIAGFSNGVISEPGAPAKGALQIAGTLAMEVLNAAADFEGFNEVSIQNTKEKVSSESNIQLTTIKQDLAIQQQVKQIEQIVRSQAALEYELFILNENLSQTVGKVKSVLAKGLRVQDERERFRIKTAKNIQDYRYKDMAFRIFRNSALMKYRSQFDMAAQYAFLAAKAYDYDTALMDSDTMSINSILAKIVKEQMIGTVANGVPMQGDGLAGILAEMKQNYDVLKGQLGFNNPQIETNYFSLRSECFRIVQNYSSNDNWKDILEGFYVDNIWDVPEFRRYCKPFSSEYVREPGIVIKFKTDITSRLNFFGHELGAEPYYAPENYATKIRSVGIWLSNYDTTAMSPTPRFYLIPVGQDYVRASNGDVSDFRSWQVIEQAMPTPFPVVESNLYEKAWIPIIDSLPEAFGGIRRHVRLRAYPDGGFNPDEMTYDSRLVGRSVWNTSWILIIPGSSLLGDPDEGISTFLNGTKIPGSSERTGNGVTDIKLFFKTYSYSGY